MLLAKVIGYAHGTVCHPTLRGRSLLLCEREDEHGVGDGQIFLAVDRLGAGAGQRVMVTSDGSAAARMVGTPRTPLRHVILGLVDAKAEVAS